MSSINTQDFSFLKIATLRFLDPLTVGIAVSFQSSQPPPETESLANMQVSLNDTPGKKWNIAPYNDENH